jgi:hypothetical protein
LHIKTTWGSGPYQESNMKITLTETEVAKIVEDFFDLKYKMKITSTVFRASYSYSSVDFCTLSTDAEDKKDEL